jgi:DNA-binding MarR family transcriptional regulator
VTGHPYEDLLGQLFGRLFRLRGVLDLGHDVPGTGTSASEAMALHALLAGSGLSQQDLGAALGLEKSTVSRLVDGLARKGWADRARDPANRRYQLVRITPAGRDVIAAAVAAMGDRHARIMAELTEAERRALAVAVPALVRALDAVEPAAGPTTSRASAAG